MHCVIHREMLASQKMSPEPNILQDVIKTVNHLKVYALNSRLFVQLWEDMDAGHTHLLLYTEVRWHSKGGSLARAPELREPLQRFLLEKQSPLSTFQWHKMGHNTCLCDIFNLLNELYLSLQGRTTVFQPADKVAVLKAKLELWGNEWTLGFFTFQTLVEILKETEPGPSFSQAMLSPMSAFKRVWPLLLNHKQPQYWKRMDPQPICEWARWTYFVQARKDQLLETANNSGPKSMLLLLLRSHFSHVRLCATP